MSVAWAGVASAIDERASMSQMFRAAVVQAAPAAFDRDASVARALQLSPEEPDMVRIPKPLLDRLTDALAYAA